MRRTMSVTIMALGLALLTPTTAFAAGQPDQSCEDQTTRPGQAATAPGSAFDPTGTAGTVYAGEQPQNSTNPMAVSQYDVACTQVSTH